MADARVRPSRPARLAALLLATLLALPAAWARAPKIPASAADHVAAANRAFQAKNYDRALEELRAAYRLAPRPEFLLSFAQIYRAAGQLQQALEACNSYLATMPNGALAPGARQLADALRAEIDAAAPPAAAAAPPTVNPAPPVAVTAPPAAVVATPALVATPAPADRGRRRKLAIGLGVGAVVVVGLAVGLGVGLTVGRERSSTFGRVSFAPSP